VPCEGTSDIEVISTPSSMPISPLLETYRAFATRF
jgi:hypothetical protein